MAEYSSGTYTYIVLNNTTGGTRCNDCTSSAQPHPVWGSQKSNNDTIVQTTAVTIGGFNGLNS